jgi:hypothetical protein
MDEKRLHEQRCETCKYYRPQLICELMRNETEDGMRYMTFLHVQRLGCCAWEKKE